MHQCAPDHVPHPERLLGRLTARASCLGRLSVVGWFRQFRRRAVAHYGPRHRPSQGPRTGRQNADPPAAYIDGLAKSLPPPEAPATQRPEKPLCGRCVCPRAALRAVLSLRLRLDPRGHSWGPGSEEASSRPPEHRAGRHGHCARRADVSHGPCVSLGVERYRRFHAALSPDARPAPPMPEGHGNLRSPVQSAGS
jgi:hypothetical protein